MSLYITSLNSGSNGNCYYVGNSNEAVLVDVGISCRETEKRMKRLGLSLEKIKAVFISHEHSDHIKGVAVLSKKLNVPIYITPTTLKNSGLNLREDLVRSFDGYEEVNIGELSIKAFKKFHDAADPYSFVVSGNGINVGVFTDIGSICNNLINSFKNCHAAFLETNYDEEMLENGNYPYYLKNRISGDNGHLSNKQALDVFIKHKPENMSHLFLSHLSKDNNCPVLVRELFLKHAQSTKIIVASRYNETEVYTISKNGSAKKIESVQKNHLQTSLF